VVQREVRDERLGRRDGLLVVVNWSFDNPIHCWLLRLDS
jgi:hypothetical protein